MAARKIRAIVRADDGTEAVIYPETLLGQVLCTVPDGGGEIEIPLDELLGEYADEINEIAQSVAFANGIISELTRNSLNQQRLLNAQKGESGMVTLTNTLDYPFNDSVQSVTLAVVRDTTDYSVEIDVGIGGADIGRVVVYDKLKNGFKVAFTGGATSATVTYTVRGGFL